MEETKNKNGLIGTSLFWRGSKGAFGWEEVEEGSSFFSSRMHRFSSLSYFRPSPFFFSFFPRRLRRAFCVRALDASGGGGWLSRHARRRPETREAPSDDDAKEGFIKHGV